MSIAVHPIRLSVSNAYLLVGERPVLVDAGSKGEADAIEREMKRHGVAPGDLALIVHTHAHSDHVGASAEMLRRSGAPGALHPADDALLASGSNGRLNGVGLRGKAMSPIFSNLKFEPFAPSITLRDGMMLTEYGLPGARIAETPGHTAGHVSVLLPDGQGIVGDVLMGGGLGGKVRPHDPRYHYFAEDLGAIHASLGKLLAETVTLWHPGHGGPLQRRDVRRWADAQGIAQGGSHDSAQETTA